MSTHNVPVPETGHETKDANVRDIVLTLVGLGIGAAFAGLLVWGVFRYLADHPLSVARPNPMVETQRQQFPPQPRIEEHPAIELRELHSSEDKILNTYGWTDKSSGVVRIPIDRAMDLALERGFPTAPQAKEKK